MVIDISANNECSVSSSSNFQAFKLDLDAVENRRNRKKYFNEIENDIPCLHIFLSHCIIFF